MTYNAKSEQVKNDRWIRINIKLGNNKSILFYSFLDINIKFVGNQNSLFYGIIKIQDKKNQNNPFYGMINIQFAKIIHIMV